MLSIAVNILQFKKNKKKTIANVPKGNTGEKFVFMLANKFCLFISYFHIHLLHHFFVQYFPF